jgi:hypothetical protein
MKKERRLSNVEEAWLQLEEIQQDFELLNDSDLLACRETIAERVQKALDFLSPHVRDDMSQYEAL